MHIAAIAWVYVVLMMSITEHTVVAGIMTFLTYCVLPLAIFLYLVRSPQRKKRRQAKLQAEMQAKNAAAQNDVAAQDDQSSAAEIKKD